MSRPDYKLAMENAQKSILQENFLRMVSKMSPEEQAKFVEKFEANQEVPSEN